MFTAMLCRFDHVYPCGLGERLWQGLNCPGIQKLALLTYVFLTLFVVMLAAKLLEWFVRKNLIRAGAIGTCILRRAENLLAAADPEPASKQETETKKTKAD
eukprot:4055452-Amphidinium_carterae.1